MDIETLKNDLLSMDGNDLKTKARVEYEIKILPEYKKGDIVNLILEKVYGGNTPAVELPKEGKVRPGYARIELLDATDEPDPFYVSVNGYSATIPRNIIVDVPHELLGALDDMTVRGQRPDENGVMIPYIKRRAPYRVYDKDDSVPSGKFGWSLRREKSLEKKRLYFEKFGIWPTDGEIKDYIRTGGMDRLYPQGKVNDVPTAR